MLVATGPLTSDAFAETLLTLLGRENTTLNFYDAAAPLVSFESVDMDSAYFASRYDKGTPDYINCPMEKDEYLAFWQELTRAGGGRRSTALRTGRSSRAACPWRSWRVGERTPCATAP